MGKILCYIALGSNTEAELHIQRARALLNEHFPKIHFSPERWTQAIGMKKNPAKFLNLMGRFETLRSEEEVRAILKEVERQCNPQPKDKEKEEIHIDIDLLQYNDQRYKPDDWKREDILSGWSYLSLIECDASTECDASGTKDVPQ
jgi:2-amino-4-hydroxy-6-hydroxymethyldihydropteridine diphosphokinase